MDSCVKLKSAATELLLIQLMAAFLKKRGENVIASWNLNKPSINLPFSYESLVWLLSRISKKENNFSQYDFAQWCDNFTMVFDEEELSPIVEIAVIVARDIECQWDLFLINSYFIKRVGEYRLIKGKITSRVVYTMVRGIKREVNDEPVCSTKGCVR